MWLWLSLTALLCWSGSDLFSKIGCRDGSDRYSHLKMVIAVGVVMGLHAAYEIFIGGTQVTWEIIWTYLPVSLLYISSMAMGYIGLRYIELSISSPICNSSGALVAVLCLLLVLVTCGTATLGFVAFNYDGLQLPPMTWLFLQSLSLYTVYLSFQTLFFERFIACFRIKGNVGFFIVTLDFIGYTGTVVVLVFKEFFNPDINWLDFYNLMSGYVGIVCSVAFLCSAVYLVQRYRKENASGPLDSSLFRLRRWSRPGNSLLLETE